MSLTSRLTGLFTPDSSIASTQRNGYADPDLDDGARQNKRPRTMEILADEEIDIELKRPPYYQVGITCTTCHLA